MILAINIGNTNIAFAIQTKTQLLCDRILTDECCTMLQVTQNIDALINEHGILSHQLSGCIISSVVPNKTFLISEAVRKYAKINPIIVTSMMDFDINLSLYDCTLIGTDRLLCCMASYVRYKLPFVVYDLGTATTANVVNDRGFFLGGAILPGIDTGLMALTQKTALLPKALPALNIPLLGSNTNECLLSGAFYGTAGFIDDYSYRINKELGTKATVIVTGGNAPKIIPLLKTDIHYCPNLLLEGLFLLYTKLNMRKEVNHENRK